MKKRGFLNLCMVAALATVTAGSLYSCKDYDDEIFAALDANKQQDSTLGEQLDEQKEALEDAKKELGGLLDDAKAEQQGLIEDLQSQIEQNNSDMENIYATKDELSKVEARVEVLETNIKKIQELEDLLDQKADKSDVEDALNKIIEVNNALTTIQSSLGALDLKVQALEEAAKNHVTSEQLKEVSDAVAKAQGEIDANKAWAEKEHDILKGLIEKNADDLKLKADKADVEKLQADLEKLQTNVDEKEAALKKLIADEIAKVNTTIDSKISDVRKEFEAADKELKNQIDTLKSDVETLKEEVKKISVLQNVVDNMITSLAVNGAYSPVLGYFSLPTGLKSNVLSAYYGNAMDDVYFPSTRKGDYLDEKQAFTKRERELLGFLDDENGGQAAYVGGQTIVEKGEQNAGKLYVTVNPSSVNMAGKTFALFNSLGDSASVKLGKAVRSNDKLTFGYSRAAGVQNGFYEIPATLTAEGVNNSKLRLEIDDLKAAVKDVLTPDDGVNLTNVATTLYAAVNDIADAQAVAATWTDARGEHSVLSDYGIAAVAVKPLSYEFMKDFHRDNFWGIDKAYSLLDKIIGEANKITSKIVDMFPEFNLNVPNIDTIKIESLDEDLLAEFKIVYNDTVRKTITFEDSIVIDKVIELDSVKVPDMTVPIEGQTIKVPIKFSKDITVTVPEKHIWVDNPAKLKPTDPGYQPEVHDIMPDTVEVVIPEFSDTQTIVIDQVESVYVDGKNVKVEGPYVKIDDVTIHISQPVKIEKEIEIPVYFEKDMSGAVEDLYGSMTGSIQDVNKMLKDLQQFINVDLNNLLKDLNGMGTNIQTELDKAIDEIENKLAGLIEKVDRKLCQIVNSVHSKLQPAMFVKGVDSFVMLSSAKNAPLSVPSQFVLAPTTYTAELLTPAAKKFVAVTDVIKGDQSAKEHNSKLEGILKEANDGNANLNNVVPGYVQGITVENLKSGYTYEFTYSALDFHGKIVNTKYYVTVK